MSSEIARFSVEQLSLILSILVAIGGAVFWITYKIRGLEKDVSTTQKSLEKVESAFEKHKDKTEQDIRMYLIMTAEKHLRGYESRKYGKEE